MNREKELGAYALDLSGVGVAAETREEAEQLIREAIELHIQTLRKRGEPIPAPAARAGYIQVA